MLMDEQQMNRNGSSLPLYRVWVCGPFRAERRVGEYYEVLSHQDWGARNSTRTLLKALLCAPGRQVRKSALLDQMWPMAPLETARRDLSVALSHLHKLFSSTLLNKDALQISLAGQAMIWVDAEAALALFNEAERIGYQRPEAVPLLEEAWTSFKRGPFLVDDEGEWTERLRATVEQSRYQCRIWLAEAYAQQRRVGPAEAILNDLLADDPTDEDVVGRLMNLLHQHDLTHQALKVYQRTSEVFAQEGMELSEATRILAMRLAQERQTLSMELIVSETAPGRLLSNSSSAIAARPLREPANVLDTSFRPFAGNALLKEDHSSSLEDTQEIPYASLEAQIIAIALHWQPSSGSIALLQQFTFDAIRKCDMHQTQIDNALRVTRRHALQAIALLPIQLYELPLLTEMRAPAPEALLSSCGTGIIACLELRRYEPEGMEFIRHILAKYLPVLEKFARQSSPSQVAAARLTAQGYLLVNLLAEQYGRFDQMEAAARQSRFYGQIAQDTNLEVSALIRLAIKFDYEHRDGKALETYQEAMALPHFSSTSPLLQGRIYAGLAGTHAYFSRRSQALSFLSQAKEIYPNNPEADPTYPFAICDGNTLALWEGLTLKHTESYADAIDAFSRFGSLMPTPGLLECNRAEHLNYAASVAIRQRDLDTAIVYLEAAEEVAWQIKSATRQAEVRDTLHSLRLLWPNEIQVKTLQEKFYERQS